jgi:hypothetical protein
MYIKDIFDYNDLIIASQKKSDRGVYHQGEYCPSCTENAIFASLPKCRAYQEKKMWVDVNERLPSFHVIVMARKEDGEEVKCYFHLDRFAWLNFYTREKVSYFQDFKTLEFLHNITHWKEEEKE